MPPVQSKGVTRCVFHFLFFLFLCGAVARAEWEVVMHDNRRHVPIENVADFYGMRIVSANGSSFKLSSQNRVFEGKANTQEVFIDGAKYVLCFPIVSRGDKILISAMDVTKIIEPVLRPGKISNATQVRTVILDAGHGGHDSGATGPYGREKDFTFDIAKRAKALLESRGFRVLLTRQTDTFIPLEERSKFANRQSNAIFVSIHFNKSTSGAASGIETFALAPRGVPSMGEEEVSVNAVRQYPGHARDAENTLLATAVHSSLLRFCPLPDRGIKRARFHVLRETSIPSILIEGGFMNHPLDARMIASVAFRQRLAMAITEGILRFRKAVQGRAALPPPTLVATGSDPTSAPSFQKTVSPIEHGPLIPPEPQDASNEKITEPLLSPPSEVPETPKETQQPQPQ